MEPQYTQLAKMVGMESSEKIRKIFSMIADLEEADLILAMPADVPTLSEKLGRPKGETQEMVDRLFVKGLIFPSFKTDPPTWRGCAHMVQFHDASILWPDAPREFLDAWQDWSETEGLELTKAAVEHMARPVMRVIPVGLTVEPEEQILAVDDVRMAIDNAEVIAVTPCTCKIAAQKCDTTLECCVQLNNAARYAISRGTGRELSKEEALELMKKVEEEGLVHTVNNLKSMHQVICNCCRCCCQNFPVKIQYGLNSVAPSRFQATIDAGQCTGCELCLDRCFFGAIEMQEDVAEVTEPDMCVGCGLCQVVCPDDAIGLNEVRPLDYIPDSWRH
jgi:formate hydrogenlyase subunit 6/NADH:ubiquinone oxidoreductase subunit I